MSENIRNKIRQQIKPMPKSRLFPTGWNGELTFEQIAEQVSPRVSWKLQSYGLYGQDIPDSIQNGLMKLWEQLLETPDLLAETNLMGAMWKVIAGSNSTWYLRYHRRYKTYTDVEFDRGYEVEEYGISGLTNPSEWWRTSERWAVWASKVDFRLDITAAMETLAEEYDDDMKGLIALYILTTSVEPMETIATFGHPKSMVYERIKGIRDRLQRLLKEYEPIQPRTWQERLAAGEVEPYLQVVEHYQDRPLALFALYTLTTETKVRRFARDDKERKMIFYYRKKCLKHIEAAYGQAASF
jgi:hypothetical protein